MMVEITSCAPDRRLQRAGDPAPHGAAERRGEQREEDVQRLGHAGEVQADPQGADEADDVLPLAADVEHAAAEGEGDGERGQDQRGDRDQRLLQVDRGEDAVVAASVHGSTQFRPVPSKIAL